MEQNERKAVDIEAVLLACETGLGESGSIDLKGLGFWRAVTAVKKDPELVATYADRIGEIDREGFLRWVWRAFPIALGDWLMWFATVVGLAIIGVGYYQPEPWNGVLLLLGSAILLGSTHTLAHLFVGRTFGIKFTHWFIAKPSRPQPGVKTDYATYLRTPPNQRALMHASGAVVTKILPFALLGAAWGMEAPAWAWWILIIVGIVQIVTDLTVSVRSSDWKKYRREKRF